MLDGIGGSNLPLHQERTFLWFPFELLILFNWFVVEDDVNFACHFFHHFHVNTGIFMFHLTHPFILLSSPIFRGNSTIICSGRGSCVCGDCVCFPRPVRIFWNLHHILTKPMNIWLILLSGSTLVNCNTDNSVSSISAYGTKHDWV